jgi:hypothetical protein
MQIPGTMPTFVTGENNIQHLQTLSNATSFLTNYSEVPFWRFIRNTSQTGITASTWNAINYNIVEVDTDSVHVASTGVASVNTAGYYETEMCLIVEAASANMVMFFQFLLTIGPNNPNYSSGTTLQYGFSGGTFDGGVGTDYTYCCADMCPYYLYPNDSISVRAYPTTTVASDVLSNANSTSGWFAPQFTGRWVRTGP